MADPNPRGECWKPRTAGQAGGRGCILPSALSKNQEVGWPISQMKKPRLREAKGGLSWSPSLLTPLGVSPLPCL